jgi:hypothetical protein
MSEEEKAELEYLRWFRINAYFESSESTNRSVLRYIHSSYEQETGKPVPKEWNEN